MRISTWLLVLPLMASVACDSETDDTNSGTDVDTDTGTDTDTSAGIDIAGSYTDNFGGTHDISDTLWISGDLEFAIAEYDNDAEFALAQNGSDNAFGADLYSRFDWSMNSAGNVVFCQSVFDGETLEDARAGSADADDLDAGCGGFAWSILTEVE